MTPANSDERRKLPLATRLIVIAATLTVIVGGGVLLAQYLGNSMTSEQVQKEKDCCWTAGVTPAWTIELLGVSVPRAASDRRAAYKSGRVDTSLLAFTLPSAAADGYLEALNPPGTTLIKNFNPEGKDYKPLAPFARLGLPEPETIVTGMRLGGLCQGDVTTPEGRDVHHCVDIYAHEFTPGSTRIYMRASVEPGASPPTPGGTSAH
ncbi:hypothetical protein ABZ348_33005 [Streptomyces sp. NPDC005963]|uniref:hypothetical protein n=1 Tax=Streptomyces sp. NPDC005963 TaxID=3156721 RepID=UPI00341037EF